MELESGRLRIAWRIAAWSIPLLLTAFALRFFLECRVAPACLWGSGWKPVLAVLVGIQWALPALNLWALGAFIQEPGRGRRLAIVLAIAAIALFVITIAREEWAFRLAAGYGA